MRPAASLFTMLAAPCPHQYRSHSYSLLVPSLSSSVNLCNCSWWLNNGLCQGIIHPSNSPYASQVVIVCNKSEEIHLCVDYRRLNSINVRDTALHAVHSSNVFTSFDLVQGYLQLAMAEYDTEKTTFRAGSSGLYEFTCMPFGLPNMGSSFCRLMKQCLGDQQFITLLLYPDDICILLHVGPDWIRI